MKRLEYIKFVPFEDVATGLLAQLCDVTPSNEKWELPPSEEYCPGENPFVTHWTKPQEMLQVHRKHLNKSGTGPLSMTWGNKIQSNDIEKEVAKLWEEREAILEKEKAEAAAATDVERIS